MIENRKFMPSLLDREISSAEDDAFGHRHFAKALESLIESPENEPPFSVGLLGKWGTGKSSIKEMYLQSLYDDRTKNKEGKIRSERFHTISFNAWRFGGENIKRALLRHVFLALGGEKTRLKDELFHQIQRPEYEKRDLGDIVKEGIDKWGFSLLQVGIVFAFIIGILYFIQSVFKLSNEWIIGMVLIFTIVPTIKYLSDPKRFLIPRYANISRIELPSSSAEEYEDLLIEQLGNFKKGEGKNCERIVVFVDDLDRLSPEEMISGLDAVRTFMEIPKNRLPNDLRIVFVISCDEERVADALADRRKQRINPDLPGAVFSRTDARRFLDRIFQFRLEIPQFPKQDMRNFSMKKLTNDLPEIAQDLEKREVSLENVIDRMIHVDVQSPRNALQILNTFTQCWWLARLRERDGSGTERPGGLQEGAVTNHPIALAAICALRVNFPDFYSDLQQEPDIIKRFTDVFIRELSLGDQPETTQKILQNYLDPDKKELKTEHQSLRQYIASLQGLRWPSTLQPLLLLSQDPVTRKFGDKAPRLFEALVSGDHQGVLIQLGRDKDSKPLSLDDVRKLRDMDEELHRETVVRRNNAGAVIAALAKRIPEDQAHFLLIPLSRRLAESPELRSRIGVSKIRDVLPHATADDRREVAGKLIENLLRTEGEIDFRLESGEPPSLDEAAEMAREVCDLVLWVRQQDGLDAHNDRVFLNWLENRRVAIDKEEHELPFSDLENWMSKYEGDLLPSLKGRYTKLLADIMEADEVKDLDTEAVIRRSRTVFQELVDAGEDSRAELWGQLNKYVSVRMKEAVALAWEFMDRHVNRPDPVAYTVFVKNFAERLNKDLEDEENWELDGESGSLSLLNMIEKRRNDIGEEAQQTLVNLAISWSKIGGTEEFATRLLDSLCIINNELSGEVISNWTSRVLTDLPDACLDWVGKQFIKILNDKQRDELATHLQPAFQRDNLTEEEGNRYQRLMGQMPEDAIKSDVMQNHLQDLFNNVAQRHNNPNEYLYRVFPAIPRLIKIGPPAPTGSMLHTLFTNAQSDPTVFGWLHAQMAEYWPLQKEELNPYNPQQLFNIARDIANQHPNTEQAYSILSSMREMVQRNIVENEQVAQVIETACVLWPYHQEQTLHTFQSFQQIPNPSLIANLMDQINSEEPDESNRLSEVWAHMAGIMTEDQRIAATKEILGKPPKGTEQEPDLCVRLWMDAQQEHKVDLLRGLVTGEGLNDDQRKRILLQIGRIVPELGMEFFIGILPEIFKIQDAPETVRSVLEAEQEISEIFPQISDRYKLGSTLLKAFISSPSQETKNKLAAWINNVDAASVLGDLKSMGETTKEDLEILREHFPKSKHLDKIKVKQAD